MLVDHMLEAEIRRGRLGVSPYDPSLVQPNSLDLRLDRHFLRPNFQYRDIDLAAIPDDHMLPYEGDRLVLRSGGFVLGSTVEEFVFPHDLVGQVEGKSSLGRLGLLVHVTAGLVDSGFRGQITLELHNVGPWSLTLHAGQLIAQLTVESCSTVRRPYEGRYQRQRGPIASRFTVSRVEPARTTEALAP